jgi:hypothetical protein
MADRISQPRWIRSGLLMLAFVLVSCSHAFGTYDPKHGRWLQRDPGPGIATSMRIATASPTVQDRFVPRDPTDSNQYADGMNLYRHVGSNPTRYVDPQGTWKRVGNRGHVWEAEKGDTLSGLAAKQEYGGNGQNWRCLWPTKDTKDHGYPNTIRPCDKYDASNLAVPSPGATRYRVIVAKDLLAGFRSVFGSSIPYMRADKVAGKIQEVSGEGATPVSYLLVAGHSGSNGMSGWKYDKTTEPKDDKTWYRFTAGQLTALSQAPTFVRAKERRGPVRCWFTRDAKAVFPGCNSSKAMAKPLADKVLRRGAVAWGTNTITGWWGGEAHWDWQRNSEGEWENPQSHGPWHTAPVWEKHQGAY